MIELSLRCNQINEYRWRLSMAFNQKNKDFISTIISIISHSGFPFGVKTNLKRPSDRHLLLQADTYQATYMIYNQYLPHRFIEPVTRNSSPKALPVLGLMLSLSRVCNGKRKHLQLYQNITDT